MGKITGFMEIERRDRPYAPVPERIKFYKEFVKPLSEQEVGQQGARTVVEGLSTPPPRGDGVKIEDQGDAAERILAFLVERKLVV